MNKVKRGAAAAVCCVLLFMCTAVTAEGRELYRTGQVQVSQTVYAKNSKKGTAKTLKKTASKPSLSGKQVSILGDSISTYYGYIPGNYGFFYPNDVLSDVNSTWWMQVFVPTGASICANASSSGSTVCGQSGDPTGNAGCSSQRIRNLTSFNGTAPDVVFVYMGMNDLLKDMPIGSNDGTRAVAEGDIENFTDAYTLMLDKIRFTYPNAQIYCVTFNNRCLLDKTPVCTYTNRLGLTSENYNAWLKVIAANKSIPVIDVYSGCGITPATAQTLTVDGIHPNAAGAAQIAACIRSYFR
jgi:lysophospholipase L1-like esterase